MYLLGTFLFVWKNIYKIDFLCYNDIIHTTNENEGEKKDEIF